MLVKLGAVVAEARGSVGGAVFSRNRSGAYVRNRTKPVDPSTARQNAQRTRMSASVVQWRALDEAERLAFNAKALVSPFVNRLGETINLSGMNLFMRSANLLAQAGIAPITVPPVSPILDDKGAFASYTGASGLELNSTVADWPTDSIMLAGFAIDLTNSTVYFKGPYPKAAVLAALDFTLDVAVLEADADLQADSSQGVTYRLVAPDGAASAIRYARTFKPPV